MTDAAIKPGDEVRLVGELPESLAEEGETWLREIVFVVRYTPRDATVDVPTDLTEEYRIATVSLATVEPELSHPFTGPVQLLSMCTRGAIPEPELMSPN